MTTLFSHWLILMTSEIFRLYIIRVSKNNNYKKLAMKIIALTLVSLLSLVASSESYRLIRNQSIKSINQQNVKDCGKWIWSECEPEGNEICGLGAKTGQKTNRFRKECQELFKSVTCIIPCNSGDQNCVYNWKESWFSECDPVKKIKRREVDLLEGDLAKCPATKTIIKPCNAPANSKFSYPNINSSVVRPTDHSECSYQRGKWGLCNNSTNLRVRINHLVSGNESECGLDRIIVRKCEFACRYLYGTWSESCRKSFLTRNGTLVANEYTPNDCPQTIIAKRKCRKSHKRISSRLIA